MHLPSTGNVLVSFPSWTPPLACLTSSSLIMASNSFSNCSTAASDDASLKAAKKGLLAHEQQLQHDALQKQLSFIVLAMQCGPNYCINQWHCITWQIVSFKSYKLCSYWMTLIDIIENVLWKSSSQRKIASLFPRIEIILLWKKNKVCCY